MAELAEGQHVSLTFFAEVWGLARPYLVKLLADFVVSVSFYLALFLFKALTAFVRLDDWAGRLILHFHSVAIVVSLLILGWLFVNDIIQIHRKQK